jgi:hypothetical protein
MNNATPDPIETIRSEFFDETRPTPSSGAEAIYLCDE